MARRVEPPDGLDYFPTPPWATRAFCAHVLGHLGLDRYALSRLSVWEPAAGEGHMAEPLGESFGRVIASDVFDYGRGYRIGSFTGIGAGTVDPPDCDWIVSNPPFNLGLDFILRGLALGVSGVAMLLRTSFLEGVERYERLFAARPPTLFAPYVERVPMTKGRWDPAATTATAYAWFVWVRDAAPRPPFWIPPGCRRRFTLPDDRARFAAWSLPQPAVDAGALFAGGDIT